MDDLLRQKRLLLRLLTQAYQTCQADNCPIKYADIHPRFSEVEKIFTQIIRVCDEGDVDRYEEELIKVVTRHTDLRSKLAPQSPITSPTTPTTSQVDTPSLPLPPIELPKFNGSRDEYHQFLAQFMSSVHDRQLDPTLKLRYLLSCLQGKPLQLVAHLSLTWENYEKALCILQEKYENKRKLIFNLLTKLATLPRATSVSAMEDLTDNIICICHALETHGSPIGDNNTFFIHQMLNKIDITLSNEFRKKIGTRVPTVSELLDFLKTKSAVEDDEVARPTVFQPIPARKPHPTAVSKPFSYGESKKFFCPACSEEHQAVRCEKFRSLDIKGRRDLIFKKKLCYNCMRPGHTTPTCRSSQCNKCGLKHHTLLHDGAYHTAKSTTAHSTAFKPQLLPTAIIPVRGENGAITRLRALLDTGSTSSFISEEAAARLQLKRNRLTETIYGINGISQDINQAVHLLIPDEDDGLEVTALIVPRVTQNLPARTTPPSLFRGLQRKQLADPTYNESAKIDVLLSCDIFFSALRPAPQLTSKDRAAVAVLTKFGYIVASKQPGSKTVAYHTTVDEDFKKLWELEQETDQPPHPEDQVCEEMFLKHTKRNIDGRYQVKLPITESTAHLFKTRPIAFRRFESLSKTLKKKGIPYQHAYDEQLQDYLDRDHMEPAPTSKGDVCFLPHHAVFKAKSTATKMRIVFDASASPQEGRSLNTIMLNGPRLQEPLASILMRFRKHPIAITADIEKMYRQIHLHPDQFNLHRILWRSHPGAPVEEYRLKRLTFGTKAAPFLATRVLLQLSRDEELHHPTAAKVLREDFYVDDLMTGAASEAEARFLCSELSKLLTSGGFHLQKWNSNCQTLCEQQSVKELNNNEQVTTLGLIWEPHKDSFSFSVNQNLHTKLTKRSVLSEAARLFDPLGWASPVTMFSRIFLQTLWKQKFKWDDTLPITLQEKWRSYQSNIQGLRDIMIPRYLNYSATGKTVLCGFSDASEKAMSACIYLKNTSNGITNCHLIAAKGKVAPLKMTTIPKLELTAATLLVKFMKEVHTALRLPSADVQYWTDSTITLAWIQSPSYRWETFVANRVATIQSLSTAEQWHHVPSLDNPADLATKPISSTLLASSELWWRGPSFLRSEESTKPVTTQLNTIVPHELQCQHNSSAGPALNLASCGSLNKLCRVYGYVMRFIQKLRHQPVPFGTITSAEYHQALTFLVRVTQKTAFSKEIKSLTTGTMVPNNSKLKGLTPFLDTDGNLRVLGRLANADLPYEQKHPLILPHTSYLTTLIIEHYHRERLHAGPNLLLSSIRSRFWIIGGKRAIKKVTHRCLVCHRLKVKMASQLMGNLPSPRTIPARPFTNTGVDYAGPIQLRPILRRSKIRIKGYICIFVCLATKAVHLEPVSDMTSEAFLAALRRFTARRGVCQSIYSDNGTTFVGADNSLRELLDNSSTAIKDALTPSGIEWFCIPPYSPHFGGLWEAGVKSVKHHLRRVMGAASFTFEEIATVLTQIEACLNSRPICPLTDDPDDMAVLTPGHFLIGAPLTAPPDVDLRDVPEGRLHRWQIIQKTTQAFWTRWQQEYLNLLQHRPKWFAPSPNIREGDIVLIHDSNLPPTSWSLGRVLQSHQGRDKKTRVLTIKTSTKIVQRPITKVSPLPIKDNE